MAEYLVCYDYGQGGIWVYIEADSPAEIAARYRDLTVFEAPPAWCTDEMEQHARSHKGPGRSGSQHSDAEVQHICH